MLNCIKATELLSLKSYRKLTLSEKMQLKLHMMTCSACRKFKTQSEVIDKAINKIASMDIGNGTLPQERKEIIDKHIHSH